MEKIPTIKSVKKILNTGLLILSGITLSNGEVKAQKVPQEVNISTENIKEPINYNDSIYLKIKNETKIPKDLSESEFYKRYIHAKYAKTVGENIYDDKGNLIYSISRPPEIDADMISKEPKVNFEGEKHWNLIRFFYDNFFTNPDISIDQAREAAVKDAYQYFLALSHNDKNIAWIKTVSFMNEHIDPLVQNTFCEFQRRAANGKLYVSTDLVFNTRDSTTQILESILLLNKDARESPDKKIKPFSKEEAKKIYEDYFKFFRKNSTEETKKLATLTFNTELSKFEIQKNNSIKSNNEEEKEFYKSLDFLERY